MRVSFGSTTDTCCQSRFLRRLSKKKNAVFSGHAAGDAVDSDSRSLSVAQTGAHLAAGEGPQQEGCPFTLPCVRERGTCSAFLQETAPNWSPGTLAGLLGKAEQNAAIIRRSGIAIAPRLAI